MKLFPTASKDTSIHVAKQLLINISGVVADKIIFLGLVFPASIVQSLSPDR